MNKFFNSLKKIYFYLWGEKRCLGQRKASNIPNTSGQKDGRTDRPLFIGLFWQPQEVQKTIKKVGKHKTKNNKALE